LLHLLGYGRNEVFFRVEHTLKQLFELIFRDGTLSL